MIALLQRALHAKVRAEDETIAAIGAGLLAYIAGHAAFEPGIIRHLADATDDMAERYA